MVQPILVVQLMLKEELWNITPIVDTYKIYLDLLDLNSLLE